MVVCLGLATSALSIILFQASQNFQQTYLGRSIHIMVRLGLRCKDPR